MTLGVVLAGGAARRMGGAKMTAPLWGRPLVTWPLAALDVVFDEVVVVAKRATPLPPLDVAVWLEPDEPCHPLAGIVHALRQAGGRAVFACPGDLPLIDATVVRRLEAARAVAEGQPLLGHYPAACRGELEAVLERGGPATGAAERTATVHPSALVNVNTPEELVALELSRR